MEHAPAQWYRKALAIAPGDEDALVSLAALLGNTGRTPQAIPLLQQALAQNPAAHDARDMLDDMQRSSAAPHTHATRSTGVPQP